MLPVAQGGKHPYRIEVFTQDFSAPRRQRREGEDRREASHPGCPIHITPSRYSHRGSTIQGAITQSKRSLGVAVPSVDGLKL